MLYGILIKGEAVRNTEVDVKFNEKTVEEYYDNSEWEEYIDSDLLIDIVEVSERFQLIEELENISTNQRVPLYALKTIRLYDKQD